MIEIRNFIAGQWSPARSGRWLDVFEPATGHAYARIPDSGPEEVAEAVAAAEQAFAEWSRTPAIERSRLLQAISSGIERELAPLARAESIDTGKPLQLATALDIPRAAQNFAFFAEELTRFQDLDESFPMDGLADNYTLRDPLGVAACISPWNLPLYLLTWKIAPALAAGCCVVAKPSEITPMTAHLLSKIASEAGIPAGVLNLIHGAGARAGAALVSHPRVRAISFTGSTRTGAEIARMAAPAFKKLSLEMGGKNATIVFADRASSLDETAGEVLRSAFTNQGQICLCGSRIFIERPFYERFRQALVEKARALRQGDPLESGAQQGAVVSREHFEKVMSYIELARSEGGRVLTGGARNEIPGRCAGGWFIQPTLIEGLGPSCRVNQEEIFGPVATLIPFDTEEEAVAAANGTRYGLSASIWSADEGRAERVASKLEAGVIWVNCWLVRDLRTLFGGMKDSGMGREGGMEALRFFTEPKNVCVKRGNPR